jgi:hypothetical protein
LDFELMSTAGQVHAKIENPKGSDFKITQTQGITDD